MRDLNTSSAHLLSHCIDTNTSSVRWCLTGRFPHKWDCINDYNIQQRFMVAMSSSIINWKSSSLPLFFSHQHSSGWILDILTVSRSVAKHKRQSLTALQLAPSSSHHDNVQLHPISALHKHWSRGPETDTCIYMERVKHKHCCAGGFASRMGNSTITVVLHVFCLWWI